MILDVLMSAAGEDLSIDGLGLMIEELFVYFPGSRVQSTSYVICLVEACLLV